ncbi:MAG: hypothetical protein HRU28_00190 [Rhizobiales bacterium]|nr:hypothetical protein [Hyphomicrobiales bacterium]
MKKYSFQLYSARNFSSLADLLKTIASMGYEQVEGFSDLYNDLEKLTNALELSGLQMTSGHFGIDELENDIEGCMAVIRATNMKAIFCPYLSPEERPLTAVKWSEFGTRLQKGFCRKDFRFLLIFSSEPINMLKNKQHI